MKKLPRLVYIDLLRGYLLFAIIIDHLQRRPNLFELFTGRGTQWASAAEGFFFLSGLMLGYVRGSALQTKGTVFVLRKILTRTLQLYLISTLLILLFTWWGLQLGGTAGLNGTPPTSSLTWSAIWDIFSFRSLYGWTDFLNFYVLFLLESIPILLLLRYNLWPVAALISLAMYLFGGPGWYWNWQLLFLGGTIVGYYYPELIAFSQRLSPSFKHILFWTLVILSCITYCFSLFYNSRPGDVIQEVGVLIATKLHLETWAHQSLDYYQTVHQAWFDRQNLTWQRLSFFALWFSSLMLLFRRFEKPLSHYLGWLFLPLGRASLLTFSIHGIVVFWIDAKWPHSSPSILVNAFISLLVLLIILILVRCSQSLYKRLP